MSVSVAGVLFKVHSCVMRNGSEYFRGLLENARPEDGKFHFSFSRSDESAVGVQAFRVVLDFIYTDQATVHMPDVIAVGRWDDDEGWSPMAALVDVLRAADYLSIEPMVQAYTQVLKQTLTPETVVDVLELLEDISGLQEARQAAVKYFVQHAGLVQVPLYVF